MEAVAEDTVHGDFADATFAATGNPNSADTPHWPEHAAPGFLVQELGDVVRTIDAPEPELCALFDTWSAQRN